MFVPIKALKHLIMVYTSWVWQNVSGLDCH
jgi:hypothetical protein